MGTWAGYSHNFYKSSLRWLWSKIKYLIAVGADGCWNIWLTLGRMEHIHPTRLRVEKSNYSLVPSPKNQIQTVKNQLRKEICLCTFFSFLTDITFATQFGWSHTETNIRSQSDKCKWTPQIIINKCEKNCSKNWWEYQARMVDKPSNSTFAGGINDMLFINPKKVASTFVLYFSSRLVLNFTFISDTKPHNLAHILNHLQMNVVYCIIYLPLRSKLSGIALANTCIYLFLILFINK